MLCCVHEEKYVILFNMCQSRWNPSTNTYKFSSCTKKNNLMYQLKTKKKL